MLSSNEMKENKQPCHVMVQRTDGSSEAIWNAVLIVRAVQNGRADL